jgi:phenylpyruvate tautomerase PptA (4-oxalocrotonate tautomerase family)
MPYYRCVVPKDAVPFEQRQDVARAFTDVHCGMTGAPRNFVHVTFLESDAGEFPKPYYIDGGNRAGRPAELKERLLGELKRSFKAITGVADDQLGGRITEGPASWSMEGGHVLPEPGEEGPEWHGHAVPQHAAPAHGDPAARR